MNAILLAAVAAAVVAIAIVAFLLTRLSKRRHDAAEAFSHFRCPGCKRRIRYLPRQVGRKASCSNCGAAVTYPPVSQSID